MRVEEKSEHTHTRRGTDELGARNGRQTGAAESAVFLRRGEGGVNECKSALKRAVWSHGVRTEGGPEGVFGDASKGKTKGCWLLACYILRLLRWNQYVFSALTS
jgi:hypothetical protein